MTMTPMERQSKSSLCFKKQTIWLKNYFITPFRKTLNATLRGRFEIIWPWYLDDDGFGGYLRVCRIFGGGRRWPRGRSGLEIRGWSSRIEICCSRWWKMLKLHHKLESTFTECIHHTTNKEGFGSAYKGKLKHSGKLGRHHHQREVFSSLLLWLCWLKRSWKCTFPRLLFWC